MSCPRNHKIQGTVSITSAKQLTFIRTVSAESDETELFISHMETLELIVNHEKNHLNPHGRAALTKDRSASIMEAVTEMQVVTHHTYENFLVGILAVETPVIKLGMIHLRTFKCCLNAQYFVLSLGIVK